MADKPAAAKEFEPPRFLRVANYERFQHYKDRRPIWIKLHVAMLDSYEITKLDPSTRLLALMLLLVAATHDNNIPYDPGYIAGKVAMDERTVAKCLFTLLSERFLLLSTRRHSASKTLARRSKSASPEQSRAEKRRKPLAKQAGPQLPKAALPDIELDGKTQSLAEWGDEIARARGVQGSAPFGSPDRLLEVLPDMASNSRKVLDPLLEASGAATIEHCRNEVLVMQPRRPTAYAVRILQQRSGGAAS